MDFAGQYFPRLNREPFAAAEDQREAWYTFVDLLCAVSLFEIDGGFAGRRERVGSLMSYLEADELIAPREAQETGIQSVYREEAFSRGQSALTEHPQETGECVHQESEAFSGGQGALTEHPQETEEAVHQEKEAFSGDREPAIPEAVRRSVRRVFDTLLEKGYDGEGLALFPLSRLFLKLDELEVLAAVLALAATHSRKYERIFALLSEERNGIVRPTIGLCVDLGRLFLDSWEREVSKLFAGDSFFTRYVLEENGTMWDSQMSHTLALRREALAIMLGDCGRLGAFPACVQQMKQPVGSPVHTESFGELVRLAARHLVAAASPSETAGLSVVQMIGERGAGKRFLVGCAAREFGVPVLAVDVRLLSASSAGEIAKCADLLILQAALRDVFVYLHQFPEEGEENAEEIRMLFAALSRGLGLCFAGVERRLPESAEGAVGTPVYRIALPPVPSSLQELLWKTEARERGAVLAGDVDLGQIVSKYPMNPGRIHAAMTNAVLNSVEGGVVTASELEEQIRRVCSVEFGQNATRLSSPFTWEDLMVGSASERMLRLAADRIRWRARVLDTFGFAEKLPYGRGVAIALYGPPGTGKTMAAQVLANELGLEIFRVDLSQVSSKYIGETEKNLGEIFEAAKHSNAVLFFDEADALFSKRTEVASSNDKYANAETSYLLQKIEEYDGVSILATNNMQNFDAAFKRRMTYIIPLEAPDVETRRRLWEKVFPKGVPLGGDIDFALLARSVELSGAQIKAVALACAYRAAAEGRDIAYEDFIEAIDLECAKTGTLHAGEQLRQAIMML